jgi:hypothetical protein
MPIRESGVPNCRSGGVQFRPMTVFTFIFMTSFICIDDNTPTQDSLRLAAMQNPHLPNLQLNPMFNSLQGCD